MKVGKYIHSVESLKGIIKDETIEVAPRSLFVSIWVEVKTKNNVVCDDAMCYEHGALHTHEITSTDYERRIVRYDMTEGS
jgi:hypothetical protein